MESCCQTSTEKQTTASNCPVCKQKGKIVQLITLKALLKPTALETIDPESVYLFCSNSSCAVVYFSDQKIYRKDLIKIPVFQKDGALGVPVCYCFEWTRERLIQAVEGNQRPTDRISEHVQANRCGCEINNPQGSCCLGNVTTFIRSLGKS